MRVSALNKGGVTAHPDVVLFRTLPRAFRLTFGWQHCHDTTMTHSTVCPSFKFDFFFFSENMAKKNALSTEDCRKKKYCSIMALFRYAYICTKKAIWFDSSPVKACFVLSSPFLEWCQNWGEREVLISMKKRAKRKIDINIKSGHVWERQRSAKCSI